MLQYWLSKFLEVGELYPLRLAQRPKYSRRTAPKEEARVICAVRKVRLSPAGNRHKAGGLRAVAEAYPCVRRDLIDAFISLFIHL